VVKTDLLLLDVEYYFHITCKVVCWIWLFVAGDSNAVFAVVGT